MNTIKELRNKLKLTQTEFAKKIGVTMQTVQNWEYGKSTPPASALNAIAGVFGVNRDWLLTGVGAVFTGAGLRTDGQGDLVSVPYYKYVRPSAGLGLEIFNEQSDGEYQVPFAMFHIDPSIAQHVVILYVSGYSMSPRLDDGDGLLVNISETVIRNEGIYVIRWGDSLMVKIVQRIKDGVRLISNHPDFSPVELVGDECADLQVIGRVVGMFTKL